MSAKAQTSWLCLGFVIAEHKFSLRFFRSTAQHDCNARVVGADSDREHKPIYARSYVN